jgi:hypothetical protein
MILFYDHLVDQQELRALLQAEGLDLLQTEEVLEIWDATLHHALFTLFLDVLPASEHDSFLARFTGDPGGAAHLEHLSQYDPEIAAKIRGLAQHHQVQFLDAIHAPSR